MTEKAWDVFYHREPTIEAAIRDTWSAPLSADRCLDGSTIAELLRIGAYEAENFSAPFKQHYREDNHGAVGARATMSTTGGDLHARYGFVDEVIREHIGPYLDHQFTLQYSFITTMHSPLTPHSDTSHDPRLKIYKSAQIPLEIETENENPGIVFFQQRYTGMHAKFLRGSDIGQEKYTDLYYYKITEPYDFVYGHHNDLPFDAEIYRRHLDYFDYTNLNGLSFDSLHRAEVGRPLIWDRCQIHASTNWRKEGVRKKTSLLCFLLRQ